VRVCTAVMGSPAGHADPCAPVQAIQGRIKRVNPRMDALQLRLEQLEVPIQLGQGGPLAVQEAQGAVERLVHRLQVSRCPWRPHVDREGWFPPSHRDTVGRSGWQFQQWPFFSAARHRVVAGHRI
jgi:hypothetical protein